MRIRMVRFLLFVSVILLLTTSLVQAQRRGRDQGLPRYDTASVVTVTGTVDNVNQQTGLAGWSGTHFTLKSQGGAFDVHLGPTAFLEAQGLKLNNGEQAEVTGSKVKYQNADALLAREVKIGDKVFQLRDERGYPKWSRGRRR